MTIVETLLRRLPRPVRRFLRRHVTGGQIVYRLERQPIRQGGKALAPAMARKPSKRG